MGYCLCYKFAGTTYAHDLSFTTLWDNSKVVDYDGNEYNTVNIGEQIWMQENLRVTHYSDGTAINYVENNSLWEGMDFTHKAFCWAEGDSEIGLVYGAIYNWAGAMNGSPSSHLNPSGVQGACPDDWHLPSDEEWQQLELYLEMDQVTVDSFNFRGSIGGKLKEVGLLHWEEPNLDATNESGFTAIGSGSRSSEGTYNSLKQLAGYWTTAGTETTFLPRTVHYNMLQIRRIYHPGNYGFSIRCIRDD